jgi:hypothetical protein
LSLGHRFKELQEAYSIGQVEGVKPEHGKGVRVSFKGIVYIVFVDAKQYHFYRIER